MQPASVQRRLAPFYKNMSLKEYKFLMGNEKELTLDSLRDLLVGSDLSGFDPVAEAFKVRPPPHPAHSALRF